MSETNEVRNMHRRNQRMLDRMAHECFERTMGFKMTRDEADDLLRSMGKRDRENEIKQAISLLRSNGYTVRKK